MMRSMAIIDGPSESELAHALLSNSPLRFVFQSQHEPDVRIPVLLHIDSVSRRSSNVLYLQAAWQRNIPCARAMSKATYLLLLEARASKPESRPEPMQLIEWSLSFTYSTELRRSPESLIRKGESPLLTPETFMVCAPLYQALHTSLPLEEEPTS